MPLCPSSEEMRKAIKLPTNTAKTGVNVSTSSTDEAAVALDGLTLEPPTLDTGMVDTPTKISTPIDSLFDLPTNPPSIYVDIEGIDLCRHGSVSILQLYVLPTDTTHLIDVHTLKSLAFTTPSTTSGQTLKHVFESAAIPKAFFDIRNDSDALYALFGINVAGIHDIQLMENASRSFNRRCVNGLSKCIERDCPMTLSERRTWLATKEVGVKAFAPEKGGSYQVFNERPLRKEIRDYCMQDVKFLPRLWKLYDQKMGQAWKGKVAHATVERIKLSQSAGFNGKGRHMALGPWA
ncbi:hypothetical protein BU24DRAFT_455931 [Aaosphaeria arxii CBS 175.79]|uniref:3'-5' exonuclease domain-containing protein n=1 Tax=Aaosphaeria arxii CBS 175.79 TaxID=1450172 RepID=A0A6A5X7V5_9PLEO|nr:uncharacterized protein BU24DRAFT_455931 [Aaosphaeria arxii CBS 175.79]KAF2009010.1 hypothetical protein BU24DRAFT_455931 [Aaosphaeria arxii CBS 175.79]